MEVLLYVVVLGAIAMLVAAIPAAIADVKGRSWPVWVLYALVLWPVALIHAIVLSPNGAAKGYRDCPFCAEPVKTAAKVCRHCGRDLAEAT